jgi:hypothetical protein
MIRFEPLSDEILTEFEPIESQKWSYPDTIKLFEDGYPPHQCAVFDDDKCVLIMGLFEEYEGIFWTWTIFGVNFKPIHYKHFIRYWKNYLNLLDYSSISHIIDKQKPWSRHMVSCLGFQYSHDYDENNEWWVIKWVSQ